MKSASKATGLSTHEHDVVGVDGKRMAMMTMTTPMPMTTMMMMMER